MTATIDDLTQSEADLTPGTLCWVQTGTNVPGSSLRNRRVLAVYTESSQRWLLLIASTDKVRDTTSEGWLLRTRLPEHTMTSLNLVRFVDSHRGWWASDAEFVETAIGYWCMEHSCFHGSDTCPTPDPWSVFTPPSDEPERAIHLTRIAELERDVATLRAANEALVKDHQEFIDRASEILGEEADEHDLCETYDRIAERAGLHRRVRQQEVTIEVTYRQVLVIESRSLSRAEDEVRDAELLYGWHPDTVVDLDFEENRQPTDVTVKVITEPVF